MTCTLHASPPAPPSLTSPAGDAEFERTAAEIIDRLRRNARRHRGSAIWLGRKNDETFSELSPNLYDGSGGIALTLALWGRADSCAQSRQLAMEALFTSRRRFQALAAKIAQGDLSKEPRLGGGFTGVGSAVYTLSSLGTYLADPGLAVEALDLCRIITPARIERQQKWSLVEGVSGLLLALLSARRAASRFGLESQLSDSIQACGERLRHFLDDPGYACPSGLGYGLSGIAYALVRLQEEDPKGDWHWDAHSALAQERLLFDPRRRTWMKTPDKDQPVAENAWCEGPAGMLLARSAIVARNLYPQDPTSAADLDVLLEQTRLQAARRRDHLCCGNLGQALILQQVGQFLGRQELIADAQQVGRAVASRAPDSLFLPSAPLHEAETWVDPGLMTGLAGIAYAFLRLSRASIANLVLLE